ncbi:uncharacterized protein LOC106638176 [Copidosoma floridanum]|uniref:uncharacterized protein LOC106638176 n=1 Tax=Copidosoma floridanum TaxID=29053 RepID=UPI0006C93FAF|nr:uncharacterized protein LOC106638176 [Copidosoma floridanum]
MNRKASDDPRQVLAILNSLGVVGVTAPELKAFMKELKLYRKIKEHENDQWKEETKAKILGRYELLEIHKTNSHKPCALQNVALNRQERKKTKSDKSQKNCLEIVIDRKAKRSVGQNKENNVEKAISTLAISFEKCKTRTPQKNSEKTCAKKTDKVEARPASAPQTESKAVERPSRQRTKSLTSFESRSQSKMRLRSRSKSFIRSPQSRQESRSSSQTRKGPSDPVALYNKYKSIWDQLSLPGEKTHAKLRWAVREKMLGSEPYPKPVVEYKRPLRTLSKGRKK